MQQHFAFFKHPYCILFIAFLFINNRALTQVPHFQPSVCDSVLLTQQLKWLEQKVLADKKSLEGDLKKEIGKIYDESFENVQNVFNSKQILTDAEAVQYMNRLTEQLVNANPFLSKLPLQVYLSRSGMFNAFSTREGVVVFYGGLFSALKTEGQVAFVLSHEIAHIYLQHAQKSFEKYVNTLYSKEVQEELKRIKNASYQKRKQLEALTKGIGFDNRRHSRGNETAADSLAVEIMHAAGYSATEAIAALAILNNIDKDTLQMEAVLKRYFNAADYPFKNKWLHKETGLLGGHAELDVDHALEDSLKTHPDCQLRITKLNGLVTKYTGNPIIHADTQPYKNLQKRMLYEGVYYYLSTEHYAECLQLALKGLQLHGEDPFLITCIGKCFNGMHDARKKHVLGKLVPLPSPDFSTSYNTLLQFIENLYPEEMAAVGYYFLNQHAEKCTAEKDFEAARKYAASNL
jgi:Zn-dependent protease with chaperone function